MNESMVDTMKGTISDQYAVFGHPIEHSKSPLIHRLFAQQVQQNMQYSKTLVPLDEFKGFAAEFFSSGGKGLNITVPFKLQALEFAHSLSERARRAGAVNTLALQSDGSVLGDNTDGLGLVNDISVNLSWPIAQKEILILGAGGAVRGALEPIIKESPGKLVIANRTVEKAQNLAREFADLCSIEACSYDDLAGRSFDIIINGTAAGLTAELPPLPDGLVHAKTCCYDMMYGAKPTVFMDWAEAQGAVDRADGLGMLVEQAAESFNLWRGVKPETNSIISYLRNSIQ